MFLDESFWDQFGVPEVPAGWWGGATLVLVFMMPALVLLGGAVWELVAETLRRLR